VTPSALATARFIISATMMLAITAKPLPKLLIATGLPHRMLITASANYPLIGQRTMIDALCAVLARRR
jgi:hypothetical protein